MAPSLMKGGSMGSDLKDVQKVLLVMLGGIGDMVLCLPSLQGLRKNFSAEQLVLLTGEPGVEGIISGEGCVSKVVVLNTKDRTSWLKLFPLIRAMHRERFDLAIVASGINAWKGSLLTCLMGVRKRVGIDTRGQGYWYTHKVEYRKEEHELDGTLRILASIGINVTQRYPVLSMTREEEDFIDRFLAEQGVGRTDRLIGMHAGSGVKMRDQKRWPRERFAQLADEAASRYGVRVVLTGGPQEAGLNEGILGMMRQKAISTEGRLTIRQTAALVKRCDLFVSNDSGIAHVAAAVQVPVIVLFGPTEIGRIGPRGKKVVIVRKPEGLDALSVAEVQQVLEETWNAAH